MTEERDPKVSRRYRELSAEEPPRELDQAILAAAHRAADHSHAPLVPPVGRHRWYFAFGAAAILVLAVAVTVQVERQPDPEAMLSSPASVPGDREDRFYSQAEKENKAQAEPSKPLAGATPPPARERRKTPAQAAPATPAPPQADSREQSSPGAAGGMFSMQEGARKSREAAPATAPAQDAARPQAAEAARADRLEAKPERPPTSEPQPKPAPQSAPPAENLRSFGMDVGRGAASPLNEAPAAPAPSQADSSAAAAGALLARPQAKEGRVTASIMPPQGPEQFLERIAELRKEGRHEEADKALEEFRKLYPDYRISEEMLKKVERK